MVGQLTRAVDMFRVNFARGLGGFKVLEGVSQNQEVESGLSMGARF